MDLISKPEDSAQKSKPDFEALFQNATIGILAVNEEGIIELANPFVEKMLGFNTGELTGHHIEELIPEDLRNIHKEHRKDYLKEPRARLMGANLDLHARCKDGFLLPVEISLAHYQSDGNGMVVAYMVDITRRKKAEDRLRTDEYRFRLLIENTPAPVAMLNTKMEYIMVSKRWLKDFRLENRDVTGLSHFEIFPEVPERWKALLKRGLAGETLKCDEDPFPRQDGSIDWVRWELTPWYTQTGEVGGIIIFSEVITERKKAEETLRQTEERYRLFFEAIHETLLIMGAVKDSTGKIIDLRFIDLNRQAEKEYGKPRSELIGHLRSEFVNELDPDLKDIVNRVLIKKEVVKTERYVPLFKKWYEIISYSPVRDQMVALGIDLTHRKEQDNNLKRANNKLRQRTKTLQKLNSELRDLAYISSHHLQEPLRKLQVYVSLLQKSQTDSPDIKGKEFLSNVTMEASAARERVEDLLFFINLNINKRRKAPVSLVVLLKNVLEEMRPEIDERQGTVELLDEPPAVYADPDMIKHLFHQLISNGLKFQKAGVPPHIKIHSAITAEGEHGHPATVQIHFEDNGIGIDERYIPKLFTMFKKLDKESSGSGIGLAVSRKICTLHGGDLTIKTKVGEGSMFTVTLPIRP